MLEHVAGNTFASKRSLSRAAGRQLRQFKSVWRSGVVLRNGFGEGRLLGLEGPCPSMTDASVPLAEAPFPFNSINLKLPFVSPDHLRK